MKWWKGRSDRENTGFIDGENRELVVLLHAYRSSPRNMDWVRKTVSESPSHAGADFFIPPLPTSLFSFADPIEIVQKLLVEIDQLYGEYRYERITLIGHSLGALMARKLYVCACGENADAPFELKLLKPCQRPWAEKVERIILLAGMNRGWTISYHMGFWLAFRMQAAVWLGIFLALFLRRPPLIFTIQRGSAFITQLRIQWLSMIRHPKTPNETTTDQAKVVGAAATIQLLGSVDDLVSPDDNIDLATGGQFVYLDVPRSGHADVIVMDDSAEGLGRRQVITEALNTAPDVLKALSLQPDDQRIEPDERVENVIFVIHGIRDVGYWTRKIARRVMERWRENGQGIRFASVTATYGYYTLLPFLLPGRRREKVMWLMDQYTEALAAYPNAEFSYVGHSNGTYLLAQALKENPSCHFKRVVFAGSVVPSDYDWASLIATRWLADGQRTPPQVESILNYVATCDWVVAILPNGLGKLGVKDLGGAGHDGFKDDKSVHQVKYARGGHGAALGEAHWDEIARFVTDGQIPATNDDLYFAEQAGWLKKVGRFSWVFWLVLPPMLSLFGWLLFLIPPYFMPNRGANSLYTLAVLQTLTLVGYVWLIFKIFTRF